nr:hypothetical protein Iba_chr11aCG10340 [Ipomoea batatas]
MHHGNVWSRGPIERLRYPTSPVDKFAKESTDKGKRPVINVINPGRRNPSRRKGQARRSPKGAAPRLPAKSPITTPLTSLKA